MIAMAIKMPLGFWALIAVGLCSLIWDLLRRQSRRSYEWIPLVIALLFIAQVSSQTGFTHHVRYVLPAYGFLFIIASRTMVVLPRKAAWPIAIACLLGVTFYQATHPGTAHAFFNPVVGGPNNGWRYLSESNVDWGQSTYRMAAWVKTHPEKRPMTVLFRSQLGAPQKLVEDLEGVRTTVDWRYRTTTIEKVPAQAGWFLLSSFQLTLDENRFFNDKRIAEQVYPDAILFRIDNDQLNVQP